MSTTPDATSNGPAGDGPDITSVGDEDAFGRFFDRYQEPIYAIAWRVLGDEALAVEVTENVFAHAWRLSAHRETHTHEQGRWLLRLTHSMAISACRKVASSAEVPHADDARLDVGTAGENDTPEALLSAARRIVEMAFWGGLTCREIAESCRKTADEVIAQMHTGLRVLSGEAAPAMALQTTGTSDGETAPLGPCA